MSDRRDTSLIGITDDSRRSFMKKGALATAALALGGSAIGTGAAQEETPDDGGTGAGVADGDSVLMLHPDAVEDAAFTVASDRIDWSPIDGRQDGAATPGEETPGEETPGEETPDEGSPGGETPDGIGEETPTAQQTTPDGGTAGAANYETYLVQYEFSASHVAPVFVPDDVDLARDDQRQLGEIEEIVEQPGGDGGLGDDGDTAGGVGQAGEPLFVRVRLSDGATGTGTPGDDGVGTPEAGGDDDAGTPTPGAGTTEEGEDDDGGLLG